MYLQRVQSQKIHYILKPLDLRPLLYIIMHEAVILYTCRIVIKFLAKWLLRSARSVSGTLLKRVKLVKKIIIIKIIITQVQ
jgi:hypothetical protein